jgi:hypothetical protein
MKSEVKKKMSVALREVVVPKSRRQNFGAKSQPKNASAAPNFIPRALRKEINPAS